MTGRHQSVSGVKHQSKTLFASVLSLPNKQWARAGVLFFFPTPTLFPFTLAPSPRGAICTLPQYSSVITSKMVARHYKHQQAALACSQNMPALQANKVQGSYLVCLKSKATYKLTNQSNKIKWLVLLLAVREQHTVKQLQPPHLINKILNWSGIWKGKVRPKEVG